MSKFSASDAAFVGFRLVREHPRTVAIWAAAMTVLSLSVSALTIQLAGPQLAEFMAMSSETNPEPAAVLGIMKGLAPVMLLSIVYSVALYAVMLAAVNRMIQRPADDRSAYLRLGQDEVQQGITLILVNLLLLGLYLCAAVAYGVLLAIGFAAGGVVAGLLGLIGFVGLACLLIYVAVRLSLASAITFDTGKVAVRASWAMTKGHVGGLLGAYLLSAIMSVIVYLLFMTIIAAVGAIVSGGITGLGGLFEPDMSSLKAFFTPVGLVRAAFAGVVSVLTTLILFSPVPTIYQALKSGRGEPTEDAAPAV
ncbi:MULTISPECIES: hypothetical protein [unclassified Caulobacter]|uniref:hypothetical protein n=1 Tax=unclassified Caulobacter TaxID=2648921 RepID=UPI000D34450A|nr:MULTISPECIES: hypothetical protein [unclassified Caulobacter]PTS89780.1 hypothetical protein DBR21_05450 [Caulobacter sp. HMWF009]PTT11506.1 hypothetical protein DBR10_03240 [Caulobacter sp. HMWF025]PTT79009.1 hypothetical protein DBR41_22325 [Pseudomonas sp. HMWF010]